MPRDTPRAQVARFVREKIDGQDRVEIPDLVEMAVGQFMHDPQFVAQFMREQLHSIVYGIAQNVVPQTRSCAILVGTTITTPTAARRKASGARPRWQIWLEYNGREFVQLPRMTREELLAAAELRDTIADRQHSIATLWRALAASLQPGQAVGDVYDDAAIDAVIDSLAAGTFPATPALPPSGGAPSN